MQTDPVIQVNESPRFLALTGRMARRATNELSTVSVGLAAFLGGANRCIRGYTLCITTLKLRFHRRAESARPHRSLRQTQQATESLGPSQATRSLQTWKLKPLLGGSVGMRRLLERSKNTAGDSRGCDGSIHFLHQNNQSVYYYRGTLTIMDQPGLWEYSFRNNLCV